MKVALVKRAMFLDVKEMRSLSLSPFEISEEKANEVVRWIENACGWAFMVQDDMCCLDGPNWCLTLSSYFIRVLSVDEKIDGFFYYIRVFSKSLSARDILEIFNGILDAGYFLEIPVNHKDPIVIRSLEELMVKMELERL